MVNFGLNTASFLGIILALAGAGLYFLRSVRPELSRDQDIAFTAIGIICGFILIFQGWRLDPILQFGQLLLSGSAIYFAYESIKLRGIATEQAKEKSQIVDERPISRRYKAEIEDRDYIDDKPRNSRRIRGEGEDRDERPRRRSTTRQLPEERFTEPAPRRRRSEPARSEASSLARRPSDNWDNDDDWNDEEPVTVRRALPDADLASQQSERRSTRRRSERPDLDPPDRNRDNDDIDPAPRRRRPRPDSPGGSDQRMASASSSSRQRPEPSSSEGTTANYVDYEPIDPPSGLPPSGVEPIVFPDRY
jgi:Ycf66 protein N-terminus